MFNRQKIDVAEVVLGMYIAQLDRPWLETPFLFQGFVVREPEEMLLLRDYCQHVYIDVNRGISPRDKLRQGRQTKTGRTPGHHAPASHAAPRTFTGRLMRAVTRLDPTGRLASRFDTGHRYRNTVSTTEEAPRAVRAFDTAVASMDEVLGRMRTGTGIDLGKIQAVIEPMIDSVLRNQDAMAWLVYLRNQGEYAYHHSIASAVWAVILGRHLGFEREGLDTLAMGGMLLDIGKTQLPDEVFNRPGPLSPEERALMKTHVARGAEMARNTDGLNPHVLTMIEGHHERADGSGYPKGLRGGAIPVYARIAGLADCYDAMTNHRPWAPAKSPYDAVRELNALAGVQFQKEMIEQFVQAIGMFPTGSVVEMNTGDIGIVIEQNRVRRLRPKVLLVLDAAKNPLGEHRTLDLRLCPGGESEQDARWIVRGHEPGAFGLDPKNYFLG